jgi:hypothetical protein
VDDAVVGKTGSLFERTTTHRQSATVSLSTAAASFRAREIFLCHRQLARHSIDRVLMADAENGRSGDLGVQPPFQKIFALFI